MLIVTLCAAVVGLLSPSSLAHAVDLSDGSADTSLAIFTENSDTTSVEAAGLNDLVIHNISSRYIYICRDWNFPPGQNTATSCPASTSTGYLRPGEDSRTKYGWSDTDGLFIPAYTKMIADGTQYNHCRSYPVWMKVSPTIFNHHYDITSARC